MSHVTFFIRSAACFWVTALNVPGNTSSLLMAWTFLFCFGHWLLVQTSPIITSTVSVLSPHCLELISVMIVFYYQLDLFVVSSSNWLMSTFYFLAIVLQVVIFKKVKMISSCKTNIKKYMYCNCNTHWLKTDLNVYAQNIHASV